jgi:ribose 5-phosphate isomerase B
MMRVGIAADHGGFELKELLAKALRDLGYELMDFGAPGLKPEDDYPDFVVPLAKAVSEGKVDRGVAICGSGVGACLVVGHAVAWELVKTFLQAKFSGAERFQRRLEKVAALENKEAKS